MGRALLIFLCLHMLLLSSGSGSGASNRRSNLNFDEKSFDVDSESDYDYNLPRQRINRINRPSHPNNKDAGCPKEFGQRCVCGYRLDFDPMYRPETPYRAKYFVECANAGFTNTSMLAYLPEDTEVLIFTGNKISTLKPNALGTRANPNLRIIDMRSNGIRTIDGKAFHHVDNVDLLYLAHNDLSNASLHTHSRVFSNFYNLKELYLTNTFNDEIWSMKDLSQIFIDSSLTKLEKLHLGQNEIEVITNRSIFCDLPALRHLYIPQNRLTDDTDIDTSCFAHLTVIDLQQNRIRKISPDSKLWKLLNVTNRNGENIRIELRENPFICDCLLQPFINWLKNATVSMPDVVRDNENIVCDSGAPSSNKGMRIREVTNTECISIQLSNTNANSVVTGVIWVISLICVVMAFTILYNYRRSIFRNVRPLLQPTTHGVKYTSIDKNEEAEIAHV